MPANSRWDLIRRLRVNYYRKNTEALLVARKEIRLEVSAGKTKNMIMS